MNTAYLTASHSTPPPYFICTDGMVHDTQAQIFLGTTDAIDRLASAGITLHHPTTDPCPCGSEWTLTDGEWYETPKGTAEEIAAALAEQAAQAIVDARIGMSITPRQARLALAIGGYLEAVEAYIATAPKAIQIEWEYALSVERDYAPLVAAATALGLTDAALDQLFTDAATL